jgi:PDZ domain
LMRYDSRSQTVDAISSPVIEHFLVESQHLPYRGFPRAGLGFSPTRDPQLRRYLKLQDADGGVYVNQVDQSGPAAKAGVKEGDVLVAIDDKQVDPDGNYLHPVYGKLSITHLTTTEAYAGQSVTMTVIRDGDRRQLQVELFRRPIEDYAIEPYTIGQHPRYYILGGLVFEELTRQYLREWGANWLKDAPERLVYYDRFQSDLFPEKRKIVFLTQILPTEDTVGYEQLSNLVVTKLNGRKILSLNDFAEAAKNPTAGYHKIEFEEDPHEIYLDAKQVEEDSAQLQKTYSIPALRHL